MEFLKETIKDLSYEFEIFDKLCDKARKIGFILTNIDVDGVRFLDVYNFDECLLKLTPIEQILYLSLTLFNFLNNGHINICFQEQYQLNVIDKKYTVDFIIYSYIDYRLSVPTELGLKRPLIIECDGFDYHSKKDQMNNDYERETNLKLAGYDIIRFTGSQIYKKPLNCVNKIYKYLKSADLEGVNCE